jgi:hypothetical protein
MPHNEVIAVQVRHIADLVCLFIFSSFYILISSSFYAFHLDWFFHLSSVCFSSIFFLRDPSISSPRFGTTAQMVELIGAGLMASGRISWSRRWSGVGEWRQGFAGLFS